MKSIAIKILVGALLASFITYHSKPNAPLYSQFNWGIEQAHASF